MTTYYLYKKTHKITGLKYLGFTRNDPFKYCGSGTIWMRHLNKHGYEINTEILVETENKSDIKKFGTYYSNLWNVVESKEWANLKPEDGEGGGVKGMNKGKQRPQEHIDAMRAGWDRIKDEGYKPWNYGAVGLKGPCKKITLIAPDGTQHTYESMKEGCKKNNLIYVKMSAVNNGKATHHRGWKILNPKKENQNY